VGQDSLNRCPENGNLGESIHLKFGCHGDFLFGYAAQEARWTHIAQRLTGIC
jgi:hypothetical protein